MASVKTNGSLYQPLFALLYRACASMTDSKTQRRTLLTRFPRSERKKNMIVNQDKHGFSHVLEEAREEINRLLVKH